LTSHLFRCIVCLEHLNECILFLKGFVFISNYHSYRFYVDGTLMAVVFSEDDSVDLLDYLHIAYPNSNIELRIV
jgi:hypothetical protein